MRTVWASLALAAGLTVPARAQLAVSPGDTGALLLPVADNAGGAGNLNGVQVSTSGSPIFIPPTSLGPVAVLQGTTNYFLLNYRIPAQAFAGPLSVNLTLSMTTPQPIPTSGAVSSTFTFNVVGGAALGPDVTAPRTALFFDGPQFTDGQGNLYISTGTLARLQAADPVVAADLAAVSPTTSSLALSWTSVGDDGNSWTILSGELGMVSRTWKRAGGRDGRRAGGSVRRKRETPQDSGDEGEDGERGRPARVMNRFFSSRA